MFPEELVAVHRTIPSSDSKVPSIVKTSAVDPVPVIVMVYPPPPKLRILSAPTVNVLQVMSDASSRRFCEVSALVLFNR